MAASVCIQDKYRCYQCKAAEDIYGRSCKHGLLFPVMLLMAGKEDCPNYEFDVEKVRESLNKKDEDEQKGI